MFTASLEGMRVLIFEPFCGAAGDMVLGCLLSLGARLSFAKSAVDALDLGIELEVRTVERGGISATRVEVRCEDTKAKEERDYAEILKILEMALRRGSVEQKVIENSLKVFERLAAAEAKIHGVSKEKVRFHELGAYDTLADVVGVCAAFHDLIGRLGVKKVLSTPVAAGGGFVEVCGERRERRRFPVPAPATLEILKGSSLTFRGGPLEAELLTPTGAALLSEFVQNTVRFLPEMRVEGVGYGAGAREFEGVPNVLRATLGVLEEGVAGGDVGLLRDEVEVLETNVDDVTGEVLGNLVEVLIREGALDVAVLPATMKKGRAGHVVKVLAKPEDAYRLARRIIEETGTLGVRVMPTKHRLVARRRFDTVKIRIGSKEHTVAVKIAEDTFGTVLNISAEFEDAKRVAREAGVPVREVMRAAENSARRKLGCDRR